MTLEQSLSRALVTRLSAVQGLSGVSVINGNDDDEVTVPRVTVAVSRGAESVPGYRIYGCDVRVTVTANAWSAASSASKTGNQSVEEIYDLCEKSLSGNLTVLTTASMCVFGATYDGSLSDDRNERSIVRTWNFTVHAGMTA
jgi:hypothetical protein